MRLSTPEATMKQKGEEDCANILSLDTFRMVFLAQETGLWNILIATMQFTLWQKVWGMTRLPRNI
jgi:hypothetical protein